MLFSVVQSLVAETIKGKILVGHSIWNDLSGKYDVSLVNLRGVFRDFILIIIICSPWNPTPSSR